MVSSPAFAFTTSKAFAQHDPGDFHPSFESYECPERLTHVAYFVKHQVPALWKMLVPLAPTPLGRDLLGLVHATVHVDHVARMQEFGSGEIGESVNASPYVFDSALLAAGAVVDTARAVLTGTYKGGFCLVRPPGHHATPYASAGLCVFNNVAIAAQTLLAGGNLDRIAIVDFDTHYGDGTATIFYEDPRVLYLSVHEAMIGMGDRGFPEESGAGAGTGYNICFPVPFRSTDEQLREVLDIFSAILRQFRPQFLLVSAGFDGHYADPIGNLAYSTRGYYLAGERLRAVAREMSDGKLVATLEGGYNLICLPWCITAFLQGLMGLPFAPTWVEHPVRPKHGTLVRFQLAREHFYAEISNYWDLPKE